jgi:hypothetical protein
MSDKPAKVEATKTKSALEQLEEMQAANAERMAEIQLAAAKSGSGGYTLELYEPIMIGADKRSTLHFRAQTIRDIREHKTDDALTAALCEITVEQLLQLSSIDFAATQEVLAGFHLRRSGSAPK